MDNIAGTKSSLNWAVHISVVLLVVLWIFPTVGLFVSSFRTADQISTTGWWKALFPSEQSLTLRAADPDDFAVQQADGSWVVAGNLFEGSTEAEISRWGSSSRDISAYAAGEIADLGDGETFAVEANGDYVWSAPEQPSGRGQRVFVTALTPPEFTLENYDTV
ncbi:MAG: carbohydrate ABC transporter permease, partial [Marivivens sp.]|nr:carbohydrate ABC transporter permease [Marivivens sp.]